VTNLIEIGIKESHCAQMIEHVASVAPMEACGLVAGLEDGSALIYEISNELNSPIRYRMAPKEQLAAFLDMEIKGWDLLAIYHSHPNGLPHPSGIDLSEAAYPGTIQLIWSQSNGRWKCRAFSFDGQEANEITIRIQSGE
jgi:proteasome lid subunit RPN8/RPN11